MRVFRCEGCGGLHDHILESWEGSVRTGAWVYIWTCAGCKGRFEVVWQRGSGAAAPARIGG